MASPQWTDAFLDSMRQVTDPLGDDAVHDLFLEGDIDAVNALLHELVKNDQMIPDRLEHALAGRVAKNPGLV